MYVGSFGMPSGVPVSGKRAPRGTSKHAEGTVYITKAGGAAKKHKTVVIPRCQTPGCVKGAVSGGLPGLCIGHGGGRRCQTEGCPKSAAGPTHHCVAHGGGKRCQQEGCTRQPHRGGYCNAHGSEKCKFPGCTKVEKGGGFCCKHGGGRRCEYPGCSKHNVGGGFCIAHGGGKRCSWMGCVKQDIGRGFCRQHGGGFSCEEEGCERLVMSGEKYCKNHLKARNAIDIMLSAALSKSEKSAEETPPTTGMGLAYGPLPLRSASLPIKHEQQAMGPGPEDGTEAPHARPMVTAVFETGDRGSGTATSTPEGRASPGERGLGYTPPAEAGERGLGYTPPGERGLGYTPPAEAFMQAADEDDHTTTTTISSDSAANAILASRDSDPGEATSVDSGIDLERQGDASDVSVARTLSGLSESGSMPSPRVGREDPQRLE